MNRRTFLVAGAAIIVAPNWLQSSDRSYFSDSDLRRVSMDPRQHLNGVFERAREKFVADLPERLANAPMPFIKLFFASVIAFSMKPYGGSNPQTFEDCLKAPNLNCDNYCILTHGLFRILQPHDGPEPAIVGWNGGAVGNHAQILASYEGVSVLCDPTVGFVALGPTLNSLCRGEVPKEDAVKSFFSLATGRDNIEFLNKNVVNAVLQGSYMAGDILYYFPTIASYQAAGGSSTWATPQSWAIQ